MSAAKSEYLDRRTMNAALLAGGTALTLEGLDAAEAFAQSASPELSMPTIFIARGAPELAIDPVREAPLAHREKARLVTLRSIAPRELIYDFGGFPRPEERRNHPTPDHFLPLLAVAGVASVKDAKPIFVLEEFEYDLFSRRSIEYV